MGINSHLQGGLASLARCRRQVDAHLTSADSPSEHVEGWDTGTKKKKKKSSLLHSSDIYYLINIIFEILLKSGREKKGHLTTLKAPQQAVNPGGTEGGQEQRSTQHIACSTLAILISLAETNRNRCRPCFLIAS